MKAIALAVFVVAAAGCGGGSSSPLDECLNSSTCGGCCDNDGCESGTTIRGPRDLVIHAERLAPPASPPSTSPLAPCGPDNCDYCCTSTTQPAATACIYGVYQTTNFACGEASLGGAICNDCELSVGQACDLATSTCVQASTCTADSCATQSDDTTTPSSKYAPCGPANCDGCCTTADQPAITACVPDKSQEDYSCGSAGAVCANCSASGTSCAAIETDAGIFVAFECI